jgi:hypothetical protein
MWSHFEGRILSQLLESKVSRKIFGPKKDEVNKFRILHKQELRDLYRSSGIVRIVKYRMGLGIWLGYRKQMTHTEFW